MRGFLKVEIVPCGSYHKGDIPNPFRNWGPTQLRPMNQEDNQGSHPTISHLEIDYNDSTVASFDGKFFHFGPGPGQF